MEMHRTRGGIRIAVETDPDPKFVDDLNEIFCNGEQDASSIDGRTTAVSSQVLSASSELVVIGIADGSGPEFVVIGRLQDGKQPVPLFDFGMRSRAAGSGG